MKILFATTEAVPFCKTGGLGDVCGSLPVALEKLGASPTVILPGFRHALQSGQKVERTGVRFEAPIGSRSVEGEFLRSTLPGSDVPVYLIEQDYYFNRSELYRENSSDYRDNCERFVFFNRAVLEAIPRLGLGTQIVHCHDWPTGLLPAYLKTTYGDSPAHAGLKTLFTIHNLAYQGSFWHWDMELTGLGWEYFNWRQMEFYGQLNFMKSALSFADLLNTVSPRYAQEIQSPPMSCGMEGVLQHRRSDLSGVLNGVDYTLWDPATDPLLPVNYGPDDYAAGKAACKSSLQQTFKLPMKSGAPLLGAVGRLAEQKGIDLLADLLPRYAQQIDAQWVFLGTGDAECENRLKALAAEYPERIAVQIGFSNELAHRIEAGADMFLMPSRYEPCGLNQLYSLKYGTPPIVRETGGLADTVVDASPANIAAGTANGFSFADASSYALASTIDRALRAYAEPEVWRQIVLRGMRQDWSWDRSARQYMELYEKLLSRGRRQAA